MRTAHRPLLGFCTLLLLLGSCNSPTDSDRPASPAQLDLVSGNEQEGTAGAQLPDYLVVRVLDRTGRPVPGAAVDWRVRSGGGSISSQSVSTDEMGASWALWTLGTEAGPQTAEAVVEGLPPLGFSATATEPVRVSVQQPTANALVADTLWIVAKVTSRYELAAVSALVDGRHTSLVFSDGSWRGQVSLQGLEWGEKTVTVTATDIDGNTGAALVSVRHDRPPRLTVTQPRPFTVARNGSARAVASCEDDDPSGCVVEVYAGRARLAQANDRLEAAIPLSAYEGQMVDLQFRARDSAGQITAFERTVLVESSAALTEVAAADGLIWDRDAGRVLYLDWDVTVLGMTALNLRAGVPELKLRDRATGSEVTVIAEPHSSPRYGYLTPRGAIFVASHTEENGRVVGDVLYEWRDGSLTRLGSPNSSASLVVSGQWALWSQEGILTRRDLITGSNTTVATGTGNVANDVGPNGDVVYWSNTYQVFRFREGTTTQLTNDPGLWNTYPVTDGVNVVYRKLPPCCGNQTYRIALFGAAGEQILSDLGSYAPQPGPDYRVKGGWVAYRKRGTGELLQVWTRSPEGVERQVTRFGTHSRIEALGPGGEVVFENDSRRYVSVPDYGAAPREIGAAWAGLIFGPSVNGVFWRDDTLLVLIGRSVFAVEW